jgi:CHAT domain-containing protein
MEGVFDAMIDLELDGGRPDEAFAYLERARVAAWGPGGTRAPAGRAAQSQIRAVQSRVRHDGLAVEYALLPDRVVVWVISRGTWRHYAVPVTRDSVAALVARFHEEARTTEVPSGSARAVLFDLLLRPIESELGAAATVAIVPDRELSQLAFAALWDRRTRRYVVERLTIHTLPSAAFLGAAATGHGTVPASAAALVVGDPAFDSLTVPHVARLPGAAQEAAQVARFYPHARLMTGLAARRDSLRALLPAASILHFAGHAVVNGEQPELSYLALAADGSAEGGVLRAREIGALRLSRLQVVILSACNTLGARPTHVGAVTGLAYSFLRAGAPATVSSLWDVDDGTTTPVLVALNRQMTGGLSAA